MPKKKEKSYTYDEYLREFSPKDADPCCCGHGKLQHSAWGKSDKYPRLWCKAYGCFCQKYHGTRCIQHSRFSVAARHASP